MSSVTVTTLSVTALKGTRLRTVDSIMLGRDGAAGDRRFFVIDDHDRMLNGKHLPELMGVVAEFDEPSGRLALTFPDGHTVAGAVDVTLTVNAKAYGKFRPGELVGGEFAQALSDYVGRTLRLVRTRSAVDRGTKGAITVISRATLQYFASQLEVSELDARRFRMLIEVDGVSANAEDRWVGREARIGAALVRFEGNVGRCLVTGRDPESGKLTLPTIDVLRSYRRDLNTTEPLALGIYGRVLNGGRVRVGDRLELADRLAAGAASPAAAR